jgi:hypothetical protein
MPATLRTAFATACIVLTGAVFLDAEERLHVWFKAFIPNAIASNPNYVKPVPGRPGKFMIGGPPLISEPALLKKDPSLLKQTCYLTDSRGFSTDVAASARITTEFVLVVDGARSRVEKVQGRDFHRSSGSEAVHCQTGQTLKQATAKAIVPLTGEQFGIGGPHIAGSKVQVIFQVAAADPLIPSPSLDYSIDMTYDGTSGELSFKGSVGKFPSFEGYAAIEGQTPKQLFQLSPTGDTVWSLFDLGTGIGDRAINGKTRVRTGK